MGRHSKIWLRKKNSQYYTNFKGVLYNLGGDLEAAKIRFAEITGLNNEFDPIVQKVIEAATVITNYLTKKEAVGLLDAVYAMKQKQDV